MLGRRVLRWTGVNFGRRVIEGGGVKVLPKCPPPPMMNTTL